MNWPIKYDYASLLKKLKENYNYSNNEIAEELGVSSSLVSLWMTGKSKPNKTNKEKLWDLFYRTWIPGIVELPKNKHWNGKYYMRVEDTKNPYETYLDGFYTGYTPTEFKYMLNACKKIDPRPQAIYEFIDYDYFNSYARDIEQSCNHTVELLNSKTAGEIYENISAGKIPFKDISLKVLQKALEEQGGSRDGQTPITSN